MSELEDFAKELRAELPEFEVIAKKFLARLVNTRACVMGLMLFPEDIAETKKDEVYENLPKSDPIAAVIAVAGPTTKELLDTLHRLNLEKEQTGIVMRSDGTIVFNDHFPEPGTP